MSKKDNDHAEQLAASVQAWIEDEDRNSREFEAKVEWLFDYTLRRTRGVFADDPARTGMQEAVGYSRDFLCFLREEGKLTAANPTVFGSELRRFLARLRNPAGYELRLQLSKAMHELRRDGLAWQVDVDRVDSASKRNLNSTLWTGSEGGGGRQPYDPIAFDAAAKAVLRYPARVSKREGPEGHLRVISPRDAKQLILALLRSAQGAISFGALCREAQEHVFIMSENPFVPLDSWSGDDADGDAMSLLARQEAAPAVTAATEQRILEASSRIAGAIWKDLSERQRVVLCRYFIPKKLHGEDVTLTDLGAHSTIHGEVMELRRKIEARLPMPPDFHETDAARTVFRALTVAVMEELFYGFCRNSCKTDPSPEGETT